MLGWMLMASAFAFSTVSCKKQQQTNVPPALPMSSLSKDASAYFTTLASMKGDAVKPAAGLKKNYMPIKAQQTSNRFAQIAQKVDWKNGFEQQLAGATYLFVPVKENLQVASNGAYQFFRYLVFSEPGSTGITAAVVEVLGDKGYVFPSNTAQIAVQAIQNKIGGASAEIGSVNAFVLFYDSGYKQTASFKLNNGAWSPARISFRSDRAIRQ